MPGKNIDVNILQSQFISHCERDKLEFTRIYTTLQEIQKKTNIIKENHLTHLEKDVNVLKTDMTWVKKIQWFLITTGITTLLGIVINTYLILKS